MTEQNKIPRIGIAIFSGKTLICQQQPKRNVVASKDEERRKVKRKSNRNALCRQLKIYHNTILYFIIKNVRCATRNRYIKAII